MNENWVKKRTFDPSQMPAKPSAQAIPCSIALPFPAQRLAGVAVPQEQKQLRRNRMITAAKFWDGIATAASPVGLIEILHGVLSRWRTCPLQDSSTASLARNGDVLFEEAFGRSRVNRVDHSESHILRFPECRGNIAGNSPLASTCPSRSMNSVLKCTGSLFA